MLDGKAFYTASLGAIIFFGSWIHALADTSSNTSMLTPVASSTIHPHDDVRNLSPGTIILLVVFSTLIVYFIGGMMIRRFIGGARGNEVIPNYDVWSDLPLLIKDGAMYLFSGCRPEVVYERI